MKNWSVTFTVPIWATRPTSLRPRSSSIRCSARSFGSASNSVFERLVLVRRRAARPGAGDRADGDRAVAHAHQDFRAGAGDRKAAEIEEVEEGRGIDPPQRAIERERRQLEGRLEALRQHHLEDVAGGDVFLRRAHHAFVFARASCWRRARRVERAGRAHLAGLWSSGASSASTTAVRRSLRAHERGSRGDAGFGPHRRDDGDGVLAPSRRPP